ncbi:MAG: hypothetical protein ACI8Y8_003844, partial [Planctomycetota bacterium]
MSTRALTVTEALDADGIQVEPGPHAPTALPSDETEVARILKRASADRWRLLPSGLGGKLARCRPEVLSGQFDCVLSTRRLDKVVAYVPGDGTLTAQAGCRMDELAQHVSEHGHYLTPSVPHPDQATLGGTLGAGISGPERIRFGPARHHVLGMRVALADGTLATSGGRLVKNVTGFDLQRLYYGSRGTLCVILEASLRLFPMPEAEQTWQLESHSVDDLLDACTKLAALPLRPLAVILTRDALGEVWSLDIHIAGRPRQLAAERELGLGSLGQAQLTVIEGPQARLCRERNQREAYAIDRPPSLRITCLPSRLGHALATLDRELDLPFQLRAEPHVASIDVCLEPQTATGSAADLVEPVGRLARALREHGA